MNTNQTILLTIDVEDWFQVENLRNLFPCSIWDKQELRLEHGVHSILNLFDSFESKIRATFFILGWIAERLPSLVYEIKQRGHEIASHGYDHMMCNVIPPEKLQNDLIKSKHLLEDMTGECIKGYRAPNFSIDKSVLLAIEKAGYFYDSSYNSFDRHGRYGKIQTNGYTKHGIAIELNPDFFEIPISNLKFANSDLILPWGGGGYFRFLPPLLFNAGVKLILKNYNSYIFYIHPWELDPGQPKICDNRNIMIWRHYLNLKKTHFRLSNFISHFSHCSFLTCSQYLELILDLDK